MRKKLLFSFLITFVFLFLVYRSAFACTGNSPSTAREGDTITVTVSQTIKNNIYFVRLDRGTDVGVYFSENIRVSSNGEVITFSFVAPRTGSYSLSALSRTLAEGFCINRSPLEVTSTAAPTPPGGQYYKCEFRQQQQDYECVLCTTNSLGCIYTERFCNNQCNQRNTTITTPPSNIDVQGECGPGHITTALGCIPAGDLNDFVGWVLGKLIFVASGIAFLLMAFGALQILTSAGSPEKVKAGQELITSALSGLLFIILSLFLLKLIGVDILQIPGL